MKRRKFLELAKQIGVAIEDNGDTLEALSPKGTRFAVGPHMLRIDNLPRGRWTRPAMYRDMAGDIAQGLMLCTEHDCDYCDPRREA